MILSSVCQPWQPERAANAAQEQRSYTTSWGTIAAVVRFRAACQTVSSRKIKNPLAQESFMIGRLAALSLLVWIGIGK
jgi:hypothetical protein